MKPSSFFIIPGFNMKASDRGFSWLIADLKKKGFKVQLVPIKWKYRVMSDYISDFKEFYKKNKSEVNYILGFSYGAVIAFSSASELKPNKIFLCSLSPDFKEDLLVMKPWVQKMIGMKRLQDADQRSGVAIAKNLKIPADIFLGDREWRRYPQMKIRSEKTTKLAKNSKLIIVPNAPHRIDFPEYVQAIRKELESL